jgi:hypothetical protein
MKTQIKIIKRTKKTLWYLDSENKKHIVKLDKSKKVKQTKEVLK